MTRAPKPPRVVWVEWTGGDLAAAWYTRREGRETLPRGWTLVRYVLAPTPKRKRGKR